MERTVELREAIADGAIAGILSLEGVEALGRDPGMIRTLHRLGVRMAGLTWNRANAFADGLAEQTGAGHHPLGFELLGEMEQLGIALDLSHLSPRGCELALERFGGPVLASHANAAAVFANPRNLADDVLAGVGERGGVVGLCAIPAFVGPGDPTERLAEHHAHIAAVAGADAVAFGADFCGFFGDDDRPAAAARAADRGGHDAGAARPEPPRETFYADVLAAAGEPAGRPLAGATRCGSWRACWRERGRAVGELRSGRAVAGRGGPRALERIERCSRGLNAFVTVTRELALEQAPRPPSGRTRTGPRGRWPACRSRSRICSTWPGCARPAARS